MKKIITALFISVFPVLVCINVYADPIIDPIPDSSPCWVVVGEDRALDSDCDGIKNSDDNCIYTKNGNCDLDPYNCRIPLIGTSGYQHDTNENGFGDDCDDHDNDGIRDYKDTCFYMPNPGRWQRDSNDDGIGDVCTDTDFDGYYDDSQISELKDNCTNVYNTDQQDSDGDGLGDPCDNCFLVSNIGQTDINPEDGIGDACQGDFDGDGILDEDDNCPNNKNEDQIDSDLDDFGDICDNCPFTTNFEQIDTDNDGIGDDCEAPPNMQNVVNTNIDNAHFSQGSGGCSLTATAPTFSSFIFLFLIPFIIRFFKS